MALSKKEFWEKCICKECPSYEECGERAFCHESVGKSKCIKDERGCICPSCPVAIEMDYARVYYCTRGSEKSQGKKK